jgi:hypothetical protein
VAAAAELAVIMHREMRSSLLVVKHRLAVDRAVPMAEVAPQLAAVLAEPELLLVAMPVVPHGLAVVVVFIPMAVITAVAQYPEDMHLLTAVMEAAPHQALIHRADLAAAAAPAIVEPAAAVTPVVEARKTIIITAAAAAHIIMAPINPTLLVPARAPDCALLFLARNNESAIRLNIRGSQTAHNRTSRTRGYSWFPFELLNLFCAPP